MTTTIRVAHSPDSDDAFMFYALAEGKIDTGDLRYVHELQDIESLNRRALSAELEVTAVSIHAYAYLADKYALLSSGSLHGRRLRPAAGGARLPRPADPRSALRGQAGRRSPARSPRRAWRSGSTSPTSMQVVLPFDTIEDAVHAATSTWGCSFTRASSPSRTRASTSGRDLGAWWQRETGLRCRSAATWCGATSARPIINQVARDLRASIEYALAHRAPALAHAKQFNRGIGDERTDTFVGMYVNDWTVDYGPRGRAAVQLLLDRGRARRESFPTG